MGRVVVIGIGTGDPEHLTLQAVRLLGDVEVVIHADKGGRAPHLDALRAEVLRRYGSGQRVVAVPDPPRELAAENYAGRVHAWRAARAERWTEVLGEELRDDASVGVLAWGDPSLYEATVELLDGIRRAGQVAFELEVVPGISSVQVLAARHAVPLNTAGGPVHLTPARRIAGGLPTDVDSIVVMLDGAGTFAELDDDLRVWWGAYLGMPQEVLIAGRLGEVKDAIAEAREAGRERHGWLFDTYLLRRPDVRRRPDPV